MNFQVVFAGQMLDRQRRPETAVLFFHFSQNLLAFLFRPSAVGNPPRVAMLQARRSAGLVALPQPLGLPVTYSHQLRRVPDAQLSALHPGQHPAPLQLFPAQCRPPNWPPSEVIIRGHFYRGLKGTLSKWRNSCRPRAVTDRVPAQPKEARFTGRRPSVVVGAVQT